MPNISHDAIAAAGGTISIMHRLATSEGATLKRADVASIAYTIYSVDAAGRLAAVDGHDGEVLDPADVMFDELLTGKPWDAVADAIGYNFRHTIDIGKGDAFAAWGRTYLVVYAVTLQSGSPIIWRWVVRTPGGVG
jgi:hypothetical protein